jgi:hypothetical protein
MLKVKVKRIKLTNLERHFNATFMDTNVCSTDVFLGCCATIRITISLNSQTKSSFTSGKNLDGLSYHITIATIDEHSKTCRFMATTTMEDNKVEMASNSE